MQYSIQPVAIVNNNRKEIEDDNWGSIMSTIELTENFNELSLKGVDEFSHLEIIFYFDKVADEKIQYDARHPRNNKNYPEVGIFCTKRKK